MDAKELVQAARSSHPELPPHTVLQPITYSETADGEMASQSAALRAAALKELQKAQVPEDRVLLCFILEQEMLSRLHDGGGEFFENLYWAAFLLSLVAHVEDVHLLWRAKNLDFDTWCGFDVQFLVGAGVSRTLSYLQSLQEESASAALERLKECQRAGDFADLEQHRQWRQNYFR